MPTSGFVALLVSSWHRLVSHIFPGEGGPRQALLAVLATAATAFASVRWYRRRRMAGPEIVAPAPSKLPDGKSRDKAGASANEPSDNGTDDPKASDPPLLRKHSEVKSYSTSRFTYPGVRTFYRRHPKADELPTDPAPLPLLVFIHGLGGSAAQFQPLLTSLIHVSSCLAIDLPGCGVSDFAPSDWAAYATDALVELLDTIIEGYRERDAGQEVILIGHSMGSSLSALLASKTTSPPRWKSQLSDHVLGLVAICPPLPPPEKQVSIFRKFLWIPTPIFDLWRAWDRRGGVESASVRRFVGADADLAARRLQNRFNNQSRTPTWRRMAWGALPTYNKNGKAHGGLAGQDVWASLQLPVFIIAGANDHVTPPAVAEKIKGWLSDDGPAGDDAPGTAPEQQAPDSQAAIADSAAPVDTSAPLLSPSNGTGEHASGHLRVEQGLDDSNGRRSSDSQGAYEDPSTPRDDPPEIPPLGGPPSKAVELVVLPAPATHALLYTPSTARVLACLVSDFFAGSVSGRLSLGWQLQYLSREGKWDVKNLAKWQGVAPVSAPIAGGVFRAMKTLREVDDSHSPRVFVENWGHVVRDIIDISHDTPVYDPCGLEAAGVRYHKFPTVSKIPPTNEDADAFVALVDKIRAEQATRADASDEDARRTLENGVSIGVHCHYGFNRTGFFIVCYLVERCGFNIQAAIDEFARARPNGIRHQHFLDKLFIRYSALKQTAGSKQGPLGEQGSKAVGAK